MCFDEAGQEVIGCLGEPYRMGIFDPRLPHMVERSNDFCGVRYCVIFFKMWDCTAVLAPFELSPRYLEKNIFLYTPEEYSEEKPLSPAGVPLLVEKPLVGPLPKVRLDGTHLYFSIPTIIFQR